eukprot:GHVP01063029.1.p1 GENE.GHVP01063029.1~~GHVP01063029.1.p1  ORF type:complete len:219 (+),score=40.89 GHVP01063029.1:119-775(+)
MERNKFYDLLIHFAEPIYLQTTVNEIRRKKKKQSEGADLYILLHEVLKRDGFEGLDQSKNSWTDVFRSIYGKGRRVSSSSATKLRAQYKRYLYLFELEHIDVERTSRRLKTHLNTRNITFLDKNNEVHSGQFYDIRERDGGLEFLFGRNKESLSFLEWIPFPYLGFYKENEQNEIKNRRNKPRRTNSTVESGRLPPLDDRRRLGIEEADLALFLFFSE